MDNLVRCKACGYITTENKLKDVCPACGVPRKAFEAYKDPLSSKRSRLLEIHLHPITVHFPQAFAILISFLLIVSLLPLPFNSEFLTTAMVLLYLLPLSVIAVLITGLIDGKTRFKTVKTPILRKKIILGTVLLVLSIVNAAIIFLSGIQGSIIIVIIISVACIICEVLLGNLGSSIMESKLPG